MRATLSRDCASLDITLDDSPTLTTSPSRCPPMSRAFLSWVSSSPARGPRDTGAAAPPALVVGSGRSNACDLLDQYLPCSGSFRA